MADKDLSGLAKTKTERTRKSELSGGVRAQSNAVGGLAAVRSMPESLAAEAAVLGSMVLSPDCIGEVVEILRSGYFYRLEHRDIFEALVALYEKNRGVGIDAVLLRDELEKRGQLEEAGGVEYIAKILDSVPSAANVGYYAGIVRDKMLLRELITAAAGILDEAYGIGDRRQETGDVGEILDEAERRIFAVTDKSISGSAVSLKDVVTRSFELIAKRQGSHVTGLPTGYYQLDEWTCGLQNGEMIIIAGRPSMGKTSLALNMAEHIALVEKIPVAIFSLEMGRQQLAERFLCSVSQIDSQRVRKGLLSDEDGKALADACEQLSDVPIYIDDSSSLTPLELRAKARRLKSLYDIRCCFVDYLQLMHVAGAVESRQQEITEISRYVKALARELNIPVVVMSQLNRAPEGRVDHLPRMSDLRESGSIEQDADVVILLHREDYYHSRSDENYTPNNKAELIIAKQRNGPTASVELVFREKVTRFENAAQVSVPASAAAPF